MLSQKQMSRRLAWSRACEELENAINPFEGMSASDPEEIANAFALIELRLAELKLAFGESLDFTL